MPSAPRHAALFGVIAALALAGCERDRDTPELLTVTDVLPRQLEIGDRVEVMGEGLPVGEVDAARVILKGDVFRPGERPLRDQVIEIEGATVERDRVAFEVSDAIVERFTGRGDLAEHATFRGRVEVWIPEGSTRIPVFGSIKGDIELDFVPRAPRRVVAEAREQEAREAQAFLGASLTPEPGGGAKIGALRGGGPAEAAGLRQGDVLSSFEGNHVLEPLDVVPSGRIRRAPFAARRGTERVSGEVVLDGYRSDAARELVGSATVLGSLFLVMLVLGTRLGGAVTWLVHRIEGVLGKRERRGLLAKLVSAAGRGADERQSTGLLAKSAPALVAIGLSLTFAALPFFEQRGRTELDLAILYLMSVTSLLAMALVTGGWRAGKGALSGRFWAVVDVIVVELPAALALFAIVMLSGSLRVGDVVVAQTGAGGALTETGGWPWYWNAVKNPQLLALFFLFFATSLVEPAAPKLERQEKDTLRSMTFFFAGWMNVFVMCAILTTAFLGGYALPGVAPQAQAQSASLQAAGAALFLAKCWGVVLVVLLMRAALPRLTPDFLVATGVRWVLPLSAVSVAIALVGMTYAWVPTVERAVSLVTLTTALSLAAIVAVGVASSLRGGPRLRPRVNPLI
jgi:NADH-quinone oxidoreductase subunit H